MFFTARKRSLRRLCFYTCLSVILFTGWIHSPGRYTPPPACAPLGRYTPLAGTPPWQGTPSRYTPCAVHAGIQSTSGRYASHWECILVHLSVILFTVGGGGGLCLGGSLSRKPRRAGVMHPTGNAFLLFLL